jgi:hypothetical protein
VDLILYGKTTEEIIIAKFNSLPSKCLFYPDPDSDRCMFDCSIYDGSDDVNKICIIKKCLYNTDYKDGNSCGNSCKSGYYIQILNQNICLLNKFCPEKFYEYRDAFLIKCVLKCPTNYYSKESNPRKCIFNKNNCKLISNKFCLDDTNGYCITNYIDGDIKPFECSSRINCLNKSLYIIPSGSYLKNTNNVCSKNCPTGYLEGNMCLTCPGVIINGVCKDCKYDNKYFYKNSCYEKCPKNFYPDVNTWRCEDPSQVNKYTYNGFLVTNCPDDYFADSNGICKKCNQQNLFYLNDYNSHRCVTKCPSNYFYDEFKNCISCQNYDLRSLNYKSLCCNSDGLIKSNNCPFCLKSQTYYYKSNCLDECPPLTVADNVFMICFTCKEKGYFYYMNYCLDTCPDSTIADSDNICLEKKIPLECKQTDCNGDPCNVVNDSIVCTCSREKFGKYCELDTKNLFEINMKIPGINLLF